MSDFQEKFGARVKELRKRQGLTQEQLCEKIGIGVRSLVKIETARSFPSVETLEKLINTLEITPVELFNFEHLQKKENLKEVIINMIDSHSERIQDIYKIVKVLTE